MDPVSVGAVVRKGLWSSLIAAALAEGPSDLHPGVEIKMLSFESEQSADKLPLDGLDVVLIVADTGDPRPELSLAASLRRRAPQLPLVLLLRSCEVALPQPELERLSKGCSFLHLEAIPSLAALRQALVSAARGYEVMDPAIRVDAKAQPDTSDLTAHERTLLALIQEGYTNDAIARRVHLSPRTVESQVRALYFKLKIETGDPDLYPRVKALSAR